MPQNQPIFATFLDWAISQPDQNLASVARRWGVNDSTLRGYQQDPGRSPTWSTRNALFRRMTPADRCMLQRIEGQGLMAEPRAIDASEQVIGVPIEAALDTTLEIGAVVNDLQREVHRSTRDGRIDPDEDLRINNIGNRLKRLIGRVCGITQRNAMHGGVHGGTR
jgi:hypothetical protein